jgi:hypothetical protein
VKFTFFVLCLTSKVHISMKFTSESCFKIFWCTVRPILIVDKSTFVEIHSGPEKCGLTLSNSHKGMTTPIVVLP